MADEIAPVVEQPIPGAAEVAVVGEQPPVTAAAEASPVVEQPIEAPAAEAKPATVAETPSLLESAAVDGEKPTEAEKPAVEVEKPAEEKPVEAKAEEAKPEDKPAEKTDAEKAAEAAAAEPAPLPPVEYKFELPENVTLPDERKTEFLGVLDTFRADPANVQPLVDFHVAEVNRQIEHITQQQHDVFNDTRKTWRDEIKADPEMGGSGMQTTTAAVARMRDLLVSSHPVGTPEYDRQSKEANEFFRITGAGDHPVLWRILHNAARFLDEAKPLAVDVSPAPTGRQPGSKRGLLYNHPNSPNNKGVS